jgi:hypothetical protein
LARSTYTSPLPRPLDAVKWHTLIVVVIEGRVEIECSPDCTGRFTGKAPSDSHASIFNVNLVILDGLAGAS